MILMQQSLIKAEDLACLEHLHFLVGNEEKLIQMMEATVMQPFDESIIDFLNVLSATIRSNKETRLYPDVMTFAFWIRKASMTAYAQKYKPLDENIHVGRGISFHIAPSNVPVNYAYSLVAGLVTGNACIVRVPSKDFPQVNIINAAIRTVLEMPGMEECAKRIILVRYERNSKINDLFSKLADVRIIWGGDRTIEEIRKSPLMPRSTEITFADRYSIAVIDSNKVINQNEEELRKLAEAFYNDTFLTDQNACTSPRLVAWTGSNQEKAQAVFWRALHNIVAGKYELAPVVSVNKLTSAYMLAALEAEGQEYHPVINNLGDNYIYRIGVSNPDGRLMEYKDNSGYFFEYNCSDIRELLDVCNNTHCQTIGYYGDKEAIMPLVTAGIKGIDRVVPIGSTMDFDFIWDGYNLCERLTRTISIR